MRFQVEDGDVQVRRVLALVNRALEEKGYDPINQLIGYLLSGDPTYITSHHGARSLIRTLERDRILEVLIVDYLKENRTA